MYVCIYLFLERGEGREKEGGPGLQPRHVPRPGIKPVTGNQTSDLSVCRPAFNPLSHTSQGYFLKATVKATRNHVEEENQVFMNT